MCLFFTNINNGLKIIHCFFASWRFGWVEINKNQQCHIPYYNDDIIIDLHPSCLPNLNRVRPRQNKTLKKKDKIG